MKSKSKVVSGFKAEGNLNGKAEFIQAIKKNGGLRTAKLGQTIVVYCGSNAMVVEADLVKKAIRTGEAIVRNGVREFYEWEALYDVTKAGSDRYTWHKDGNRVKCALVRNVVETDGTLTKTTIKHAWKEFTSL